MKPTLDEQIMLTTGNLTIHRPVRQHRTGRDLGTTIKVGDTICVDSQYFAVCSINKDRERREWIIRFEKVGKWAYREPATQQEPHPLTGLETRIAHGEIRRLIWPATKPCPVKKGELFEIRSWLTIEIERVTRHLPKGQPAEWHAEFIRHEQDRPQLLRRTPAGLPLQPHELTGFGEVERARRDGSYTTSPALALTEEPESVGPDWKDIGAVSRADVFQSERRQEHEGVKTIADRRPWRNAA